MGWFIIYISLDWFQGKSTGNHGFYQNKLGVPVKVPLNSLNEHTVFHMISPSFTVGFTSPVTCSTETTSNMRIFWSYTLTMIHVYRSPYYVWLVVSTNPSEKWWSSSVGLTIPNMESHKIPWFQTTNQMSYYRPFPQALASSNGFLRRPLWFQPAKDHPLLICAATSCSIDMNATTLCAASMRSHTVDRQAGQFCRIRSLWFNRTMGKSSL